MICCEHVTRSYAVVAVVAASWAASMMTRVVAIVVIVVGNADGFCYQIRPL